MCWLFPGLICVVRLSLGSSPTVSRGQLTDGSSTTPRGRALMPSQSPLAMTTNSVPRSNQANMSSR